MIRNSGWTLTLVILIASSLASGRAWAQESPAGRDVSREGIPATSVGAQPQMPDELVVNGQVVGRRVASRPGELCLVCNEPLHAGDAVYLVQGQRVQLHSGACDAAFRSKASRFLALLQPRGAFLGAGAEGQRLSDAWFLAGLYVLVGLVFAGLCAQRALHTGHSPIAWFSAGLVLNAFGYLWLLTRPKREVRAPAGVPRGLGKIAATFAPEACPVCGTANHPAADHCIGCGAPLAPRTVSEVAKVRAPAR